MNFKKIALVLALCFSWASMSEAFEGVAKPTSQLASDARPFPSLDEAAVNALRLATSKSINFEVAGCIFKFQDNFYFTDPVNGGLQEKFDIACEAPLNMEMVAIFHTHPAGTLNSGFSFADISIAKDMKKVSYVASIDDNQIIKFIPGKTRVLCYESSTKTCSQKYSEGQLVAPLK